MPLYFKYEKPFRSRTHTNRNNAACTWASLAKAIDAIHHRNTIALSFEELYRYAYNLVMQRQGDFLYQGVSEKLSNHLEETANKLAEATESTLLENSSHLYHEHVTTMAMIRDVLMYMDRSYVENQHNLKPVYQLGLHLYRILVWEHQHVQGRVSELLLQIIAKERVGELTDDRTFLKDTLIMLQELGASDRSSVYERDFEKDFLGTTQEFYQNESSIYLAENSASSYVEKAKSRLVEEKNRAAALSLPLSTESLLMNILETELIERHAKTLVTMENSGFAVLLKEETKVEEMRDMYDLFTMVPSSVDYLKDALCARVKADGKALIADIERGASDPPTFIRGVLKMEKRYQHVVDVSFHGEPGAKRRLKESFELFLNADTRAASCLAMYADDLLRSKLKGVLEAEAKKLLDTIITVFRYISDKDVFENFYKEHLAKRLLTRRSISDEYEKTVVSLLKAECGYQFTSKLEGMFNDMRISHDTQTAYKDYKRSRATESNYVEMDVEVLTTGYWPSLNVPVCNLPEAIDSAISHFKGFYLKKYTGRKLSWQTSTGSAEISAINGPGSKFKRFDLIVSTYQLCILMLFNDKDTLTVKDISMTTNIPDTELKRHLISLSTPKYRILRKGSKGKGISGDDDTFTYNASYTSKSRKVKIPMVSLRAKTAVAPATTGNDSGLPPLVEEERRHLVEAAAVRIMKARKQLDHNSLIAEVTKQLSARFNPAPQFIKKRIEGLIEREYIERDANDYRMYKYIA